MLFRSITISLNNIDLGRELDVYKEDSDILHDPIKLQNFLDNLKKQISLFGEDLQMGFTISGAVNPEYKEYFRLYGIPPDLVFIPEKLAEIKFRLESNI